MSVGGNRPERGLHAFLESSPDAIVGFDCAGCVFLVNAHAATLLGYGAEELVGVVKSLVELHGGSVRAESAGPGRGASFTVSLPLVDRRSPVEAVPTAAAPVRDLAGLRVLVVDDEQDAREYVQRLLEGFGAEAITAATAAEALRAVSERRPSVMLCDIGMPEEDGYQLIRKVRALGVELGGETPAAALTAYTRPEDREKSLQLGFQAHIAKPVEPARLLRIVAELAQSTTPRE